MIARIEIQTTDSMYTFQTTYLDQELDFDGPFYSLDDALLKAAENLDEDRIIGVEIAYEGVVCGTYTAHTLQTSLKAVANHALDTWKKIVYQ